MHVPPFFTFRTGSLVPLIALCFSFVPTAAVSASVIPDDLGNFITTLLSLIEALTQLLMHMEGETG